MGTTATAKAATGIAMTDSTGDLYKLMTWLSPSFPVGAFSHSSGLETAIASGLVNDRKTMRAWMEDLLAAGSLWSDAVIFARAFDAASDRNFRELSDICEFANAFPTTAELRTETRSLGAAFIEASRHAWPSPLLVKIATARPPYPVAVAIVCASHGISRNAALNAFLHAASTNLVSVAVRIVPLGQTGGIKLIADLEHAVCEAAEKAGDTQLDNLSTACLMTEISSMKHETQTTRLFRT